MVVGVVGVVVGVVGVVVGVVGSTGPGKDHGGGGKKN